MELFKRQGQPQGPTSVYVVACVDRAEAARHAKKSGWKVHRDGTATCPKCAARLASGEKPTP